MRTAAYALLQGFTYGDIPKHLVTLSLKMSNPKRLYDPEAHHTFPPQGAGVVLQKGKMMVKKIHHADGAMLRYSAAKKVADCTLRSAAAPTYFPSYQGHVDGGMFANNPSLLAASLILGQNFKDRVTQKDLYILSISCGHTDCSADGMKLSTKIYHEYGILQWLPCLLDTVMSSGDLYTAEVLEAMLPQGQICRLDAKIDSEWTLDSTDKMADMQAFARKLDLSKAYKFLDKLGLKKSSDAHENIFKDP